MFTGRVIFGLGGENNLVVQCFIVEKWFTGRMLSLAFGIVMVFNQTGTTFNNYLTPFIYSETSSFNFVFAFSFIPCGISCAAAIIYVIQDKKYNHLLVETHIVADGDSKLRLSDLKKIGPIFWLIMVAQCTLSNVYYQFMGFGTAYTEVRFGNSYSEAKNYMTFIPLIIIFGLLLFSNLTGNYGKKGYMLVASSQISQFSAIILYFLPQDCGLLLIIPYTLMAIWFSLYSAAMWPAIPMVVPKKMMGVAYGLVNAGNNQGLAFYPFLFGKINSPNTPEAYDNSVIGLIVLSILGFQSVFLAWFYSKREGSIQEQSEKDQIDQSKKLQTIETGASNYHLID